MTGYVYFLAYEPTYWDDLPIEDQKRIYADHEAFHAFIRDRGTLVASAALADADVATTVRQDGRRQVTVTDGPFAETTEMIGGYYEVELPDLDTALEGAALLPRQYTVEIRPTIAIDPL